MAPAPQTPVHIEQPPVSLVGQTPRKGTKEWKTTAFRDRRHGSNGFNRDSRNLALRISAARILAENEPIGEMIVLSLCDDGPVDNEVEFYLRRIAGWLKLTEERYKAQFPVDFPQKDGRYDLSTKPEGFRSRMSLFKEIIETDELESNGLMLTEFIFEDPVIVRKIVKKLGGPPLPERGNDD
jgi:hypothetical protein